MFETLYDVKQAASVIDALRRDIKVLVEESHSGFSSIDESIEWVRSRARVTNVVYSRKSHFIQFSWSKYKSTHVASVITEGSWLTRRTYEIHCRVSDIM